MILFIKILSDDIVLIVDIRFVIVFSFLFKSPIKFISTISLFTIYCNALSMSMESLIENIGMLHLNYLSPSSQNNEKQVWTEQHCCDDNDCKMIILI